MWTEIRRLVSKLARDAKDIDEDFDFEHEMRLVMLTGNFRIFSTRALSRALSRSLRQALSRKNTDFDRRSFDRSKTDGPTRCNIAGKRVSMVSYFPQITMLRRVFKGISGGFSRSFA